MEKQMNTNERSGKGLGRRTLKFGNKVINQVIEGREIVTLNPRLGGLGGYRDAVVYPYIQNRLQEEGIATEIVTDLIESGSEKHIPRDRLIVKRPTDTSAGQ